MRIKMYVMTDKVDSEVEGEMEIDDSKVEGMNTEEIEDYITEIVSDWKDYYFDWGWEIIK